MPLARKEMIMITLNSQGNPEYRHCMAAYFWGCRSHFEEYLSCDVPTYAIAVNDTSLQLLLPHLPYSVASVTLLV